MNKARIVLVASVYVCVCVSLFSTVRAITEKLLIQLIGGFIL